MLYNSTLFMKIAVQKVWHYFHNLADLTNLVTI